MLGKDLIALARVTNLARLEFSSPRLSLRTTRETVTARYTGPYAMGAVTIPRPAGVPDLDLDLDALRFKDVVGFFKAEDEVRVTRLGSALKLHTKNQAVQLKTVVATEWRVFADAYTPLGICTDVTALRDEVNLAAELAGRQVANVQQAGIRLELAALAKQLRIFAFGGSILYVGELAAEDVEQDGELLFPADDLRLGLTLFQDGPVQLGLNGQLCMVTSGATWFRCAALNIKIPTLSQIPVYHDRTPITFQATQLRDAVTAARTLNARDYIELTGTPKAIQLRTSVTQEEGQYVTAVPADGSFRETVYYSPHDLAFVAKIGKESTFEVSATRTAPTLVRSGQRLLVLMTRVI